MLKILGLHLRCIALGVGVAMLAAAAFHTAGTPWPPSHSSATFAATFVFAMYIYGEL